MHDGTGGNNVKSRAERNEIYYNWIEGAVYHELELIGPDPAGAPSGWTEDLAREDSDVVGNVLWKRQTTFVVRFGGDGTGQSNGRYRFVNNTVLTEPGGSAVFRLFDGLESVEMHGNVFFVDPNPTGSSNHVRDAEAVWSTGSRVVGGSNNWVLTQATNVPPEWTSTLTGTDPNFVATQADGPASRVRQRAPRRLRLHLESAGPRLSVAAHPPPVRAVSSRARSGRCGRGASVERSPRHRRVRLRIDGGRQGHFR